MPTYEYTCTHCKQTLEIAQKITEPVLTTCPKCSQEGLRRGVGGGLATFRFLGDGFYINDSKKKSSDYEEKQPKTEVNSQTN